MLRAGWLWMGYVVVFHEWFERVAQWEGRGRFSRSQVYARCVTRLTV